MKWCKHPLLERFDHTNLNYDPLFVNQRANDRESL